MTRAFVFPGQGSQNVGMGKDLFDAFASAREVFEEVDDALSEKLSKLIFEGPAQDLTLTANTQPALMAVSMAAMRVLQKEAGVDLSTATCVAGHSLGEYSALCAAGSLTLVDTARLLRIRGEAMQAAVPVGEGAMAALIGATMESAAALLAQISSGNEGEGVCEIANDNAPGQVVISGSKALVEAACANAKAHKIKMAKLLPVSAPFHCSLMAPAAERMQAALSEINVKTPIVPLIANVTAQSVRDGEDIKALLVKQVTGQVRWVESVQTMIASGVDEYIEVGAGKVLGGLIRRIEKDATIRSIGSPEDLETL